jgi:hypothetical protein
MFPVIEDLFPMRMCAERDSGVLLTWGGWSGGLGCALTSALLAPNGRTDPSRDLKLEAKPASRKPQRDSKEQVG